LPDAEPAAPYEDPPYEVLVRFLGDVSVEGAFLKRRLKAKEVAAVVFIALKGPVTVDRVEDALWAAPTEVKRRRRLINIVSQCRAAMGEDHLPKVDDGYYAVGPLVKTDIDLFEARVGAASRQHRWEDAADLRLSALGLCTGEVFHTKSVDSDSFAWIEASNLVSHWEIRITDLAEELANDCLAHGDVGRAIEACEAGLRAMPTHTGCTEALMRAHAQNGDLAAVQHVFQAHATALELIHLDQVAQATAALYDQLMATT
jgi:DNA-binding SARP family transcriptional activator